MFRLVRFLILGSIWFWLKLFWLDLKRCSFLDNVGFLKQKRKHKIIERLFVLHLDAVVCLQAKNTFTAFLNLQRPLVYDQKIKIQTTSDGRSLVRQSIKHQINKIIVNTQKTYLAYFKINKWSKNLLHSIYPSSWPLVLLKWRPGVHLLYSLCTAQLRSPWSPDWCSSGGTLGPVWPFPPLTQATTRVRKHKNDTFWSLYRIKLYLCCWGRVRGLTNGTPVYSKCFYFQIYSGIKGWAYFLHSESA